MVEKIDRKDLLTEEQRFSHVFSTIFASLSSVNWNFTMDEVEKMMLDVDIKSGIDQRKRRVNAKILEITTQQERYKPFLEEQFKDLNLTDIVDTIIDSKFKGYTVQEIIYNDDYTMQKLKEKPNSWYIQQWNEEEKKYEWVLTYGATTGTTRSSGLNIGQMLPLGKYLIPIYKPTDILIEKDLNGGFLLRGTDFLPLPV